MKYENTRNKVSKILINFQNENKEVKDYKKLENKISNKVTDVNKIFYYSKKKHDYSIDFEVVNLESHLGWYIGNKEWEITLNNVHLRHLFGIDYNVAIKGENLTDNFLSSGTDELIELIEKPPAEENGITYYQAIYKIRWNISILTGNDIEAKLFFYIKNPLDIK